MNSNAYQVPHLSFFPEAFPDESLYSLVNRFHMRAGLLSFRSTFRLLFGTHDISVGAEFPSMLPQLSQATKISTNQLIFEHTTIPYYTRFVGNQQYELFINSITRGENTLAMAQLSLVANRIQPNINLKSCPACIAEDRALFGVPYWHRHHQLPGVDCCTRHALLLTTNPLLKSNLSPPPENSPTMKVDRASRGFLYSVLATRCLEYSGPTFEKKRLYACYYSRLGEYSLLTPRHQIRMAQLKFELRDYWEPIFSSSPFQQFNPKLTQYRYPETLFHKPNANHHTLKHLVLIGFLFRDWERFLSYYDSVSTIITTQHTQINKTDHQFEEKKQLAIRMLRAGKRYKDVASECGLSLSTLSCLAEQQQIAVRHGNRRMAEDRRRTIWRKLMIGMTTKEISDIYAVSLSLVGSILAAQPQFKILRKRIVNYRMRTRNRLIIEEVMKNKPNAKRVDIQRSANGAYVWLYRHDREWLFETLPREVPRSQRYLR